MNFPLLLVFYVTSFSFSKREKLGFLYVLREMYILKRMVLLEKFGFRWHTEKYRELRIEVEKLIKKTRDVVQPPIFVTTTIKRK